MWFSIDTCDGIEFHDTAEKARDRADEYLGFERDEAMDGWSEEVTNIIWGKVHGHVVETRREDYDPEKEEHAFISDCSEVVEYSLLDIE